MRKITNTSASTIITPRKSVISAVLSIEQAGGHPISQYMDSSTQVWMPDRQISPLKLVPMFEAVDEEKGTAVTTITPEYKWYINKIQNWDSTTEEGQITVQNPTADFYLETLDGNLTGSLIVRKNIWWDHPLNIICVAEYTEPSSGSRCTLEETINLISVNCPEDFYGITIDSPSPIQYRPLSMKQYEEEVVPFTIADKSYMVLRAVVSKGKDIISDTSDLKFFWYITTKEVVQANSNQVESVTVPVDDNLLAYSSIPSTYNPDGYNTDTITLDADYILSTEDNAATITVKMATSSSAQEPDVPAFADVKFYWDVPRIEATPYCTSGSAVKDDDSFKEFGTIVSMEGRDLFDYKLIEKVQKGHIPTAEEQKKLDFYDRINQFIAYEWYSKPAPSHSTATGAATLRGWGPKCVIPVGSIEGSLTPTVNTEVSVNLYVRGAYEKVTCVNPSSGETEDVLCNNEGMIVKN